MTGNPYKDSLSLGKTKDDDWQIVVAKVFASSKTNNASVTPAHIIGQAVRLKGGRKGNKARKLNRGRSRTGRTCLTSIVSRHGA